MSKEDRDARRTGVMDLRSGPEPSENTLPRSESHPRHARLAAAAVVSLLAAGVALRIALSLTSSRVTPTSDMAQYLALAEALARGMATGPLDRAMAYPLFLAGLISLGLESLRAIYLVQSALTLVVVIVTALHASALGGKRAGWAALAFFAPHLTIAQYSSLVLSEALFLPLFALWTLLVVGPSSRPPWRIGASGLVAGLAALVRPAAFPLAVGTVLALALTGPRRVRSTLLFAMAAAAAFAMGLAGASLTGAPPPLAPTAGINLYLGNSPQARLDGGAEPVLPEDLTDLGNPGERNARALRAALDHAWGHPVRTVLLAWMRALRLLGVNPGRIEHDALVGDGWPSGLVLVWLALEWITLCSLAAVGLAAHGPRLSRTLLAPALVAAPYVLVLCATFVQTRFRLPLHLLLAPYAAVGLAVLVEGFPAPSRSRRAGWAVAAVVAAILVASGVEVLAKSIDARSRPSLAAPVMNGFPH